MLKLRVISAPLEPERVYDFASETSVEYSGKEQDEVGDGDWLVALTPLIRNPIALTDRGGATLGGAKTHEKGEEGSSSSSRGSRCPSQSDRLDGGWLL